MIEISSPLKRDFIKEIVENIENPKFVFKEETGTILRFETDANPEEAVAIVKKAIKSTSIGSVLYFQVKAV
jgi:hypothetical protein